VVNVKDVSMTTPPLRPTLTRIALRHLGVGPAAPDAALLDRLMDAYCRRVPWESATRIAKRAAMADTDARPRWPEEFWTDAVERGSGGTCFESNYAFFSLLRALGFEGYLTINDMKTTTGCHTAAIIRLNGDRWLADADFPVHAPLPLSPSSATHRATPYMTYTAQPDGADRYEITRARHPAPYCFTLIDRPVPDAPYRAATTQDYGPSGLFLHEVIVTRVVDGCIWRFASHERPERLACFQDGTRTDHPIEGDVAEAVARRFGMDAGVVEAALAAVE
jgi:arylamine N-acetyltransferase